ncbi:hypothetical protein J2T09_003424 [Neorhizobium huautlense]|uniref:Uncharacterized protein n=1 Tax=Neorhizobium huautlense TaxID=67774 RepID=A0ABT9PW20_9HYPH|nr:hypothetical protein [Neorhizobium huautlense]MDP9838652.1 hypothetical protein [Neorhizobium huautlense]
MLIDLRSLISHQVKPFNTAGEFTISGPEMLLDANAVLNIGTALHELIMKRVQYADMHRSSVSVTGAVHDDGPQSEGAFCLTWEETAICNADLLSEGEWVWISSPETDCWYGARRVQRMAVRDDILTWRLSAPASKIRIKTGR